MHIGLSVQTKGQRLKTIVLYTKRRFDCKKEALDDNLTGYVWGRHTKSERFSYSAPINQSSGLSMYTRQIFRRATSVVSVINISIGRSTTTVPRARASTLPTFILFAACLECFYGFRSYWRIKKKVHSQNTASLRGEKNRSRCTATLLKRM